MSLVFWTDPHLGLDRTSHTTPASRKHLADALYWQAMNIVDNPSDTYICLGDLFDKEDNDEVTILRGANVANSCALVLSGNHDLPNRDGRMSSLQLIAELSEKSAVALDDATDNHFRLAFPEAYVVAVPHKRTQQLFDSALEQLQTCYNPTKDHPAVLVLHCNYNSGYADDDATLNLTRDRAERLLQIFDYILIGHEHICRSDFNGRLQILGNTHPTSFSDISNKYVWHLVDGELKAMQVWGDERYFSLTWEELLRESPDVVWDDLQFIEITGTCPAARMPEVSKAVQKMWAKAPEALMIRNNVKAEQLQIEQVDMSKALDIPAKITAELQGTPLLPLWQAYLEKANV